MKLELLGNGLNSRLRTTEYYLRKSFSDNNYDSFIGFSAFTKKNGINLFLDELLDAKKRFKSIKFYLGVAEKGTSKEALQFLLDNEIDTWTFCSFSDYIFHPKIYFFYGKTERRMIIGSSNLTKKGLSINGNIEASLKVDYSMSDAGGLMLEKQYFDYFDEIISATNENVKPLTSELLAEFIKEGFVVDEYKTFEDGHSYYHSKGRGKNKNRAKIEEFQEKETNEEKSTAKRKEIEFNVTDHYLKSWEAMFQLFINFKNEKGTITVPSNHSSRALYRWYRLQKIFYLDKSIDSIYPQKYEHIQRLKDAGFYFGDAHKLLQQNKEDEWMDIFLEAITDPLEKDRIGINHRYRFDGNRLGTWLVSISQEIRKENPKQRKIEIYERIKALGLDINTRTKDPRNTAQRFIDGLLNDNSPVKVEYQNKFNKLIFPKADKLPEEMKIKISEAWELRFNEEKKWEKKNKNKDRTNDWKSFRYDTFLNPEMKWLSSKNKMGSLYSWVSKRHKDKESMELIVDKFNETEIIELRNEGFIV